MTVLREIGDGLWVGAHPDLRFLGIKVGTRMTVVRLPDGDLWLHSPIPLTDEVRAEVDALGPVRHVVAPNLYHHLYAGTWAEAYPDAKLYGVKGLARKRPDLELHAEIDDAADPGWPGLDLVSIRGTMLKETVFRHAASNTLISCDLAENFHDCDSWVTRTYARLGGVYGKIGVHWMLRLAYRDRARARESMDRLLGWEFDRVILAHGDIVETDAKARVREIYAWL